MLFGTLGVLGLGATVYVLVKQRVALPFQNVYPVSVEFADASGVGTGEGQPVNVAGVKVGQVTDVRLADGRALVTLQIERGLVPHVYENASAVLEPITPLKDMQIALDPGRPSAKPLPEAGIIRVGATSVPVPLEDLLSRLDVDTRTYLSGLIASLDEGTAGRAPDIRRALAALGPSAAQARQLTEALAKRRTELARLVHNLAVVSRAASRDGQLKTVVSAGNRTLATLVAQERPLRQALHELPATLDATGATLTHLEPFADTLGPTLQALTPSVRRLPATLESLGSLADTGAPALARHVRPLVREARPFARELSPALSDLSLAAPAVTGITQTLDYTLNELGYNPPGDDEGFLFWAAWAMHDLSSALSTGDAHGSVIRALAMATCNGAQSNDQLEPLFHALGTCPG